MKNSIVVDITLLAVIIIFLDVFSLTLIPKESFIPKALFLLGLILAAFTFYFLLLKVRKELLFMDKLVLLFILTFFLCAFMAKTYWNQSFISSVKSLLYFYIFFLYFTLLSLEVSEKRIKTIIKVLFFISLVVFAIDYVTFPNPLFSYRDQERRGGITVFFSGQGFTFLGAFYFLEQYITKRKLLNLLYFLVGAFFLFFLTQSRMILFGVLLGSLFLFIKSSFKYKILVFSLLIIGVFTVYYKTELLEGIKQLNKTQAEYYKDNIRLQSEEYFLFEHQGGALTKLFGNGVPSTKGRLSHEIKLAQFQGYFASDVGITGVYSYFGLLGAVIWLLFFYTVFRSKGNNYIKAYFLALLATIFTGYSIFDPGYMSATVLSLYLVRNQSIKNSFG